MRLTSPIKHVVIIVKENHGYDNDFGPFPGGSMEDCFDFTQQALPPPR